MNLVFTIFESYSIYIIYWNNKINIRIEVKKWVKRNLKKNNIHKYDQLSIFIQA